eukprot:1795122-Rhodomonas_salina.2
MAHATCSLGQYRTWHRRYVGLYQLRPVVLRGPLPSLLASRATSPDLLPTPYPPPSTSHKPSTLSSKPETRNPLRREIKSQYPQSWYQQY